MYYRDMVTKGTGKGYPVSTNGGTYSTPTVDESGIYATQWSGGPAAVQPAADKAGGGSSSGGAGAGAGFQVDSDGVRSQAAILAQCGDQLAQVLNGLRATLEAGGEPWGTDDLGQKFGENYTKPANQGFASIAGLGTALANVANELVAQADAYDQVERQITARLTSITPRTGPATGPSGAGSPDGSGAAG
jgi:hypothetical protein